MFDTVSISCYIHGIKVLNHTKLNYQLYTSIIQEVTRHAKAMGRIHW